MLNEAGGAGQAQPEDRLSTGPQLTAINTGDTGPLTAEMIRAAVQKMWEWTPDPVEPRFLVHPLRAMFIWRRCDAVYCRYFGIRLANDWRSIYEQTWADYDGWGINGTEGKL